jgi:rod shape-determining protein MreD
MISFNILVIPLTVIFGLVLLILPLPLQAQLYRPDFVALILLYWNMALPNRVGLWVAFVTGLFVDVAQGTLLGQHSLALVIIIFINMNFLLQVRVLSLGRQAFYVFSLLLINQFTVVWIEGMLHREPVLMAYLGAPLTGMFLWPWVFKVLRDIRRKAQIT